MTVHFYSKEFWGKILFSLNELHMLLDFKYRRIWNCRGALWSATFNRKLLSICQIPSTVDLDGNVVSVPLSQIFPLFCLLNLYGGYTKLSNLNV